MAAILLPLLTRLPFKVLYPTGSKQEKVTPKYDRYYHQAEIIAGDFLYIKKYMPLNLKGKIIVTNTVTSADLVELERTRGRVTSNFDPGIRGAIFWHQCDGGLIGLVLR